VGALGARATSCSQQAEGAKGLKDDGRPVEFIVHVSIGARGRCAAWGCGVVVPLGVWGRATSWLVITCSRFVTSAGVSRLTSNNFHLYEPWMTSVSSIMCGVWGCALRLGAAESISIVGGPSPAGSIRWCPIGLGGRSSWATACTVCSAGYGGQGAEAAVRANTHPGVMCEAGELLVKIGRLWGAPGIQYGHSMSTLEASIRGGVCEVTPGLMLGLASCLGLRSA